MNQLLTEAESISPKLASFAFDVTIIGGGLAGKAAALHLSKAGMNVVCIEPVESIRQPVGESLDWSAPALLNDLGLPMEHLLREQTATWKRHVTMKLRDGRSQHYVPKPWLAEAPFYIELRTLHVDRIRLDNELWQMVKDHGVTIVRDTVNRVERNGDRISAVHTATRKRFSSPWFIDSSGSATHFLAREFKLPAVPHGPPKVAIWTYFEVPESAEGTTLHMESHKTGYLEWLWEIPINPHSISVGYVTTGMAMKSKRERGLSVKEIFQEQLLKFPRFESLLGTNVLDQLNVTSFQCRAYKGVAGPNWLIAGEAASMVDPITSNGVTAALRHAAEASELILKYRERGSIPRWKRFSYATRVLQFANFFNSGIEKIVYEPPVRNRVGAGRSGDLYTKPAWSMNVVYSRLQPKGILGTFFFGICLAFFRGCAWLFYRLCKRQTNVIAMQS